MNESILKKLAAKLAEGESTQSATESEADAPVELLEEHFGIINAAAGHNSSHYNNHSSS